MSNINREIIRVVQSQLNKMQNTSLAVNGVANEKTRIALLKVSVLPTSWSTSRKLVGFIQYVATLEGINAGPIDGKWGPQTEYAYNKLVYKLKHGEFPEPWRKETYSGEENGRWPLQNEADMTAFFGEVGTNQAKAISPYPLKLAWNTRRIVRRFTCHEKVAPLIEIILAKTLQHYGLDEIRRLKLDMWGGALNVRKMRGGTNWSTHAWGTSVDWDPQRNALHWGADQASLAQPVYDYWWQCWEDEGAVSLGRAQNRDWMHVQFARLK